MGNSSGKEDYKVTGWSIVVQTGSYKGSGTDSNIYVKFHDADGNKTPKFELGVKFRDDFERGQKEKFPCPTFDTQNMGIPTTLEIWKDKSGRGASWYCELVTVIGPGHTLHFPVLRWVRPNYRYKIPVNDTSLPVNDPFPKQREDELERKRKKYRVQEVGENLPIQLETLHVEDDLSEAALKAIKDTRSSTKSAVIGLLDPRGYWTKYEHLERAYFPERAFTKPRTYEHWRSDEWFAAQRLAGVNPMSIKLCTEIPDTFGVTDELVKNFLEGLSLEEALEAKKLFIVDYQMMDGLSYQEGFHGCAPIALFFLNGNDKLMPVAIQLFQGKYNPVFTPDIDEHKWTLAKIWFNAMDATIHQFCYHLGLTHQAMEAIAVCLHRALAPNHPIFRMLSHHLHHLFGINKRALSTLISEGGIVDKTMLTGVKGGLVLFSRMWPKWQLDLNAILPRELESRGVGETNVLPEYPYRDDGILVYNVIQQYVTDIVNIYYDSDAQIQEDNEIQEWARLLNKPASRRGAGIKGIPNDGEFKSKDELILVCTAVVATCTLQHAAVNFGQYDYYGVILNYPGKLRGPPPSNTDPITEEEVMKRIVDRTTVIEQMAVVKILSQLPEDTLGNWEVRWQYDPEAIEAENRFKEELAKVSEIVKGRNEKRDKIYQYPYLDPENIPNSINI